MRTRKKVKTSGTPEWMATFADLMAILLCFFVLLLSFSTQKEEKMQATIGSVREAFGTIYIFSPAGVIERNGNPERKFVSGQATIPAEQQLDISDLETPNNEPLKQTHPEQTVEKSDQPSQFSVTAASLRQAWQANPEITEIVDNLIITETDEGLDIILTDQMGRAMFAEGDIYPFEHTRKALAVIAPHITKLHNIIEISGHTAAGTPRALAGQDTWKLTADRANETRQLLEEFGVSPSRIASIKGFSDKQPFFANDPYLSANQRVQIRLLHQQPPLPQAWGFQP